MEYSYNEMMKDAEYLAQKIAEEGKEYSYIYPIPAGGVPFAMALQSFLSPLQKRNKPVIICEKPKPDMEGECLVVDDIIHSGNTAEEYKCFDIAVIHQHLGSKVKAKFYCHLLTPNEPNWIDYWWENKTNNIESHIVRQLEYIGEDPNREGLLETPKRIVKSWKKIFGGYQIPVESVFKVFSEGACDSMVILKDIEFFSMCEHHMLPFSGKAHIGYIPNGAVIGVSKLARLLEIFSRRMQIQERIGEQVVSALTKYLKPKGAICILEAKHHCMTSRGVEKQNSVMVTSALSGNFTEIQTRNEFLSLIK